MLRKNNPVLHHDDRSFCEYAEKMDDGRMVCKFCGQVFAKDTSISRIKFHLAGVKGRGVRICGQVPQDVQDAALAAIQIGGPPEKKLKTRAGSSNNEVTNAAQQQNNEMEPLERGSFHERPSFNQADEPRGDPSQPTNNQLCSPSVNNDVIVNDAKNVFGVRTETVVQQSNAELDILFVDAGRTLVGVQGMEQGWEEGRVCLHLDMENTGEGSVHHVDRIVPPTIDENYNRREATEILVQPDVCASAFVFYGNHNAISTSQQENVAGDEGTTPAAATRDHTPGRYFEEFSRWSMEDDEDEEPNEDEELLGPGRKRMAQLKSGWTLLMTSLILEIASAVFDQLGYAFVGMVLAFVALLLATAELLIHMAPKERRSPLPISLPQSTTHSHGTKGKKPGGTIVEYFGLVGAVWQCVYSTVAYAYARQKKDNPIKMSLLPLIFFSCVVISKLNEKNSLTRVLRKGIFLTLKKTLYFG